MSETSASGGTGGNFRPLPERSEERHAQDLVVERRAVLPAAVFQELFAVVGEEDERRPVAQRRVEPVPEAPDEEVAVADVVVVERPQVLDVARLDGGSSKERS